MKTLLILLFPIFCFAQIDTVTVYPSLDISFYQKNDTVMVSSNKWNKIVEIMRSQNTMFGECTELNSRYEQSVDLANKEIEEHKQLSKQLNERSLMYKGAYEMSTDRIVELNNLFQVSIKQQTNERKRGILTGATFGVVGGLLIGVITTSILLN